MEALSFSFCSFFLSNSSLLAKASLKIGINEAHLTISTTRNNHHLIYGVFNRAMITLGVVGLLLTIPFTRNNFFPLYCVFNRVRFIWDDADFPLTVPSPWNHLLLLH